jgi:hypothetical protein
MRKLALAVVVLILSAAPAAAQESEEQAVKDVVVRLFDGMRARDTALMRTVFAEEAQFYGVGRDGAISVSTPGDFMRSIGGGPVGLVVDEVLHDVEVRVDGPLAAVWTYYDFFAGDRFSHCGYDAIQLLKLAGEWKIVAIADSRRTADCRQQRS